jgi:hypothetical protein
MVDNAWRDSFVVKNRSRLEREEIHNLNEEDKDSLLDLERKANLAKPTGGDGLFAGTSFEPSLPTGQAALIKSGLTISSNIANAPPEIIEDVPIHELEADGTATKRRGRSIYNRATAALDTFAERIASSGGSHASIRRRGSKEKEETSEGEGETSHYHSPRISIAPQRVKSIVKATLQKATSRRKTKLGNTENGVERDDPESESMPSTDNPRFAPKGEIAEESNS